MDESWIKLSEDSSVEDGFLQAADQLQDKTNKGLIQKGAILSVRFVHSLKF